MTRSKIILVVAVAIGVLVFDVWFFFGRGGPQASPVPRVDTAPAIAASSSPDSSMRVTHRVPWADPAHWPRLVRRDPLRGELRRSLMSNRPPTPADLVKRELAAPPPPDHLLSVVLWHPVRPLAVVDGRIVTTGDEVGEHAVLRIDPHEVVLGSSLRPDERHTLRLNDVEALSVEN